MANLRTDRYDFTCGEEIETEAWICNDLNSSPDNYKLKYQLERKGKVVFANQITPGIPENSTKFQGYIKFPAPAVSKRTEYILRLGLFDEKGNEISQSKLNLEVFPEQKVLSNRIFVSSVNGKGNEILKELGVIAEKSMEPASVILIDDYNWYKLNKPKVDQQVKSGKRAIFLDLDAGDYSIAESEVKVENTIMGEYYFVSPTTGHEMVTWAKPMDFKFWYSSEKERVRPFINKVFKAEGWTPILNTGRTSWAGDQGPYLAAAEKKIGNGSYVICQLQLNNRVKSNPTARIFANKLLQAF